MFIRSLASYFSACFFNRNLMSACLLSLYPLGCLSAFLYHCPYYLTYIYKLAYHLPSLPLKTGKGVEKAKRLSQPLSLFYASPSFLFVSLLTQRLDEGEQ